MQYHILTFDSNVIIFYVYPWQRQFFSINFIIFYVWKHKMYIFYEFYEIILEARLSQI